MSERLPPNPRSRADRESFDRQFDYFLGLGQPDTSTTRTVWPVHKHPDHTVIQDWKIDDHTNRDEPYFRIEGPGFERDHAFDSREDAESHLATSLGYEKQPVSGLYRKRR